MKFADKLANLRKANNLSQEQLAEKLDVSRQSVSKWESGDTYPDMAKLIQLCKVLNCKLPDLMDDGTFDDDYKPKEKNSFSSYFNNFLDYVTKTYNMFIHMSFKSKLVCLIEMALVIGLIAIVCIIVPDILEIILDKVFRYVPFGYTIKRILSDICFIILTIIGVIVFFHIFKIRYLDYYVTVYDDTVDEQTVEEPITENVNKNKTKMVIRDPKHSIAHFLDGIGKILMFILKALVLLLALPALFGVIACVCLAVVMLANLMYSTIFTYSAIALVGGTLLCGVLLVLAINFIFRRKQPYKTMIIIFLSSLLLIGVGSGLTINDALNIKVVDSDYNNLYNTTDVTTISANDIKDVYTLSFTTSEDKITTVVDESSDDIKIEITKPDYVQVFKYDYVREFNGEYDEDNCMSFSFGSDRELYEVFNQIKEDLKNGYFRQTYDNGYSLVNIKITTSSKTLQKLNIIAW